MGIRKNEVFTYYNKCCMELERVYRYIKTLYDVETSVKELSRLRGYTDNSSQYNLLRDMQICTCCIPDTIELSSMSEELGLSTKSERFLLDDRFIIPVRDIAGNLVSLIGYYPDIKKYITIPTPFFSKDILFFNIDNAYRLSYEEYGGIVFLVEGIFDCLSLRSIGLPAIATMGSTVSLHKKEVLKLFSKVIYIPDNDSTGRKALNRHLKTGWQVPENAVGIKLRGYVDFNNVSADSLEYDKAKILKVKDVDNLVSWFEAEDVREILLEASQSKSEIVDLVI